MKEKSCKTCKYYEEDKFGGFYCKLLKVHFFSKAPCDKYEEMKENERRD
jgi:hypothetical protein